MFEGAFLRGQSKNPARIKTVKTVRFLVMCLLALAIPLQGMAAVSQLFCHGTVSSVTQTRVDHSHHEAADHQHPHDQTQASDHQASKAELAKSVNHQCSTCAQCCFGTAVLPTPISLVVNPKTSTFVATSNVLLGTFYPLNLERPPRSFLA